MSEERRIPTASNDKGEYLPAGESQGVGDAFAADAIANAFGVEADRVHAAIAGEFGLDAGAAVDSRQAQHLAEVLLTDQPLDAREAALMRLGAFTPRPDHDVGFGEKAPGEESDRLVRRGDRGDEERD
jgi:hypothetical protein